MEEPVSLSTEDEIVQSAQAPDAVAEPAALTVEQEVEMEPPPPHRSRCRHRYLIPPFPTSGH